MPSIAEIKRALAASVMLARGDAGGHRLFDHSIEGFWRSFSAILLIAPAYLLTIRSERILTASVGGEVPEPDAGFYLLRFVILIVEWFAYPVAMIGLAKLLSLGHRYVPYIIAYNWTSVVIAAVFLVPGLLLTSGLIPPGLAQLFFLAASIWTFYFRYSVARSALETGAATAIGLVIFDFLLGLLINFVGHGPGA